MDTPSHKDEEELQLEKLVFGDQEGFEANLRKIDNLYEYSDSDMDADVLEVDEDDETEPQEDGFFLDNDGDDAMDIHVDGGNAPAAPRLIDAWHDSDDEKNTINMKVSTTTKLRQSQGEQAVNGADYVARLRAQYEKIYPRPEWVEKWEHPELFSTKKPSLNDHDDVSSDEEDSRVGTNASRLHQLLSQTSTFVRNSKTLPSQEISIVRLSDANIARRSKSGVSAVHFHPASALLVTGGLDRTLRIFHIDGKKNEFVSSVHFRDTPIAQCQFSTRPGSGLVYAGGRRRHMHRWDMASGSVEKISRMYGQGSTQRSYEYFLGSPSGLYIAVKADSGYVNVINGTTSQLVRSLRVENAVADFVFTADDACLIVSNVGGDISEFDIETGRILRKWTDTSAVTVTKLALGADDRWLAVGTQSGVVNIFERGQGEPKLVKEIGSLVTAVTSLRFSHDGQVLAMASQKKKDSFRLVHMPSASVFSNWPTQSTPLGRVTDVAFSNNAQMLAIANDVGKVTLWRLNHY